VTSWPVSSLTAGTTYYYRVIAHNSGGNSSYSNVITTTTVPPETVATNANGVGKTGFTAHWNSAKGASGYRLDVASDSGFNSFVGIYQNFDVTNVTSRAVTGLTPGSTYYYRVWAYNTGGVSGASNSVSVITAATLTVTIDPASTGTGSVHADSGTISCASGSSAGCSDLYYDGPTVKLTASPSSDSINTWSGDCSGATLTCNVTMSADRSVGIMYSYVQPFQYYISGTGTYGHYANLQSAYGATVANGDVIQARGGVHPGGLTATNGLRITIKGGYDATFAPGTVETIINGVVVIKSGKVVMDGIKIR
jgi:hypothetical protein